MSGAIDAINEDVAKGFEQYLSLSDPWTGEEIAPKAPSQETPPKAVPPDPEAQRLEEVEPEPVVEPEVEVEEPEPQVEEGEEKPALEVVADGEDDVINTVAELAQTFEVEEVEFLEHMQVQGRDGEGLVSLNTLVEHYRSGAVEGESARVELEKERETLRTSHETEMQGLQEATARIIGRIKNQQAPEGGWDALRTSNPGEYIRLRELHDSDRGEAEAAINLMNEAGARKEREDNAKYDRHVAEQAQKTFRLRPDWATEAIGKQAHIEINEYLQRKGFSDDIIAGLVDANSIICVWEAAQYIKLKAAKPALRKRLSKLPRKHLAPTARNETARNDAQQKRRDAVRDKFRKSGTVDDMAALLMET